MMTVPSHAFLEKWGSCVQHAKEKSGGKDTFMFQTPEEEKGKLVIMPS